jgi:DNA-directed RNA polymerase II subunit RPB1
MKLSSPKKAADSSTSSEYISPHLDARKMGLSNDYARPEWMIITILPVPPPPVRPSISMDGTIQGIRGEDDLTYKLGDII